MDRQPLLAHLNELAVRLRRSFVWLLIGFGVAYLFTDRMTFWLEDPLLIRLPQGARLVFTTPFEKFWVYVRVAAFGGMILSLPVVSWEISSFISPALTARERGRIRTAVVSFSLVFILGVALGYQFVLPAILQAILHFGGDPTRVLPLLTLSAYINAVVGILILSAVFLEIPVLMIHFSHWGWVEAKVWGRGRRLAFIGNAIISAILSPPDILSMLVMMLPLQLLYEVGIWGAKVAEWWSAEPKMQVVP